MTYTEVVLGAAGVGLTSLGSLAALAKYIAGQFKETRQQSEDGRAKLHARIDKVMEDVRQGFVPRETHDLNMKLLHQADVELEQQIRGLSERIDERLPRRIRESADV